MSTVAARVKDWGVDDEVKVRHLNRWMDDDVLLSGQLAGIAAKTHYPHIDTADNKLSFVAAADQVSLVADEVFIVAGTMINTSDLATLTFAIPDDSTRFLRVKLPAGFGLVDDEAVDPIVRDLEPEVYLATGDEADAEGTGGGPSSPTDMRILKAVKAGAGTTPTITAYANDAHSAIDSSLPALGGGVKVFDTSGTFEPGQDSVPSWVRWVWVELVGGGGGGGYLNASGFNGNCGAGAGGAFAAGWVAVEPGTSKTVTVGAKGVAGTSGTVDGTTGGTSSFGSDVSAPGGVGGESINSGYGSEAETVPGLATNCVGDIKEDGGKGCPSGSNYTAYPLGGSSRYGHGRMGMHNAGNNAANTGTTGPGVGGRGERGASGTTAAGKDGTDGQVRVHWFGPVT